MTPPTFTAKHRQLCDVLWVDEGTWQGRLWSSCTCGWRVDGPVLDLTDPAARNAAWADLDSQWLDHLSSKEYQQ